MQRQTALALAAAAFVACRDANPPTEPIAHLNASAAGAAPQAYQVVRVPLRDDEVGGEVVAINKHDQAVGSAFATENAQHGFLRHAFLWENGVRQDLGSLGGEQTVPTDINDRGQVVGWADVPGDGTHAFFWNDGAMQDLGPVSASGGGSPNGSPGFHQIHINSRGEVLGHRPGTSPFSAGEPFLWENGVAQTLPLSFAAAINDRGQVAGYVLLDARTFTRRAVLWEDGVVTELGTLGGNSSWASAISNTGWVVGGSWTARETHAFRWRDGRMEDLGSSGVFSSGEPVGWEGHLVNDRGQVVAAAPFEQRELFWDRGQTQRIECFCPMAALGMNRHGAVVGWHAPLWQDGVTSDLEGVFGSIAVNDRGVVVGTAVFQQFPEVPVIWLPVNDVGTPGAVE